MESCHKGFTLVEIMIVVAIIVLLAALSIPNLLRSRMQANEAVAVVSMRVISSAMESYRTAQTPPVYPTALSLLSGATPPYIDNVLGSGAKSGYRFSILGTSLGYTFQADGLPQIPSLTGTRSFTITQEGVVYADGKVLE